MICRTDISNLKTDIIEKVGQKIIVKGSLGRSKAFEKEATIEKAYPNIFVVKYNRKSAKNILSGILFFSLFIATWIPINIICMFKKTENWEQIKHDRSDVDLDKLVN